MKTILALLILSQLSAVTRAQTAFRTTSTNENKCKTLVDALRDGDKESDEYVGLCAGKGGYKVLVEGKELNFPVAIIHNESIVAKVKLPYESVPAERVEWRFTKHRGKKRFHAVIYRLIDISNNTPLQHKWVIVHLKGDDSCVVRVEEHSPEFGIEQAREIADDKLRDCLSEFN